MTVTGAEVAVLPVVSRARAVRVWVPLATVVVFHDDAVGRGGVLGGQRIVVQQELHPGHADIVGGGGGEGHRARDGPGGRCGDGRRGWGGIAAGGGRGLEGGDLHDPGGGAAQRCGGAVGAGGGDDPVFGDVGVGGGDDAGGEVRSRPWRSRRW